MTGIKEIRDHIRSVQQTQKITSAMYLISSANLRKARGELESVLPYFRKIYETIADILYRSPELEHPYFDQRPQIPAEGRRIGYVAITGDKGLAGAYNHNVLQTVEERLARPGKPRLFVLGRMGQLYFAERGIPEDHSFHVRAQDPSIADAWTISTYLVEQFDKGELDEVHLIYTELVNPLEMEVREIRLLPLVREDFPWKPRAEDGPYRRQVTYAPSEDAVLSNIIPGYVKGMLFGALVESFCCEQNARMTAMQTANDNAKGMLRKLNLSYNQARQGAITQEITEIVGGSGLFHPIPGKAGSK